MVTREFLLENGFRRSSASPSSIEEYVYDESQVGYMAVRFKPGNEQADGLYAYSDKNNTNMRKVVLTDTKVTWEDFDMARTICRISV